MVEAREHASTVERWIAVPLRSAIDAHGPITRDRIGSAAKRVRRQLEAAGEPRVSDDDVTEALAGGLGQYVTRGDAGALVTLVQKALSDHGYEIVEAAALPISGGPRPRPKEPHHPRQQGEA